MQSMKGATQLLGSMNRQMNLPALQRIAMEFEKENDIMDQRQEMMDDAIDDVTGLEDEEEGEEVVNQVLDEIGVDLGQAACRFCSFHTKAAILTECSSARPLKASKRTRLQTAELRKQLVVIHWTMTSKLDWTICEDNETHEILPHFSRPRQRRMFSRVATLNSDMQDRLHTSCFIKGTN